MLLSLYLLLACFPPSEFLLLDNIRLFWDDMPGEKHFHSFPNLEHTMIGNPLAVTSAALSFAMQVQLGQARPQYEWSVDDEAGVVSVTLWPPFPESTELWYAHTIDGSASRDFRLVTCPGGCSDPHKPQLHNVSWVRDDGFMKNRTVGGVMTVSASVPPPPEGWVGFAVTMNWKDGTGGTFSVSTAPAIQPPTYPYPECQGMNCIAGLV